MTEPISDNNENWVYLAESDSRARAGANRPFQIMMFVVLSVFVTIGCCAWRLDPPGGEEPWLPLVITVWLAGLLVCAFLCSRVVRPAGNNTVWFGRDFVAGSVPGVGRGMAVARYEDIVAVTLELSKSRITGAMIRARRMTVISARAVRCPAIIVRAIFEHAPENVKWRRANRPFTKLCRNEIRRLIEDAHLPDISKALPPGIAFARADDLFAEDDPNRKGLFERMRAEKPTRTMSAVSLRDHTDAGGN